MPDIRGVLGNGRKVPHLPGAKRFRRLAQGRQQRLVGEHMELPPFQEKMEMLNGGMDGEELLVECAVLGLSGVEGL